MLILAVEIRKTLIFISKGKCLLGASGLSLTASVGEAG